MMNNEIEGVSGGTKLGIRDVLKAHGFNLNSKFRLVRHAPDPSKYDRRVLIAGNWLPLYQAVQTKPVYLDSNVIVTFTADGGTRAKFYGVYSVVKQRALSPHDIPEDCPYQNWRYYEYFYELEHQTRYLDLEGRVVIDWGKGRQWVQKSKREKDKLVLEILPSSRASRVLQPFTDYLDFTLSYTELRDMIDNPDAHSDWQASLSAVAGVYSILAETTGELYVGSAYGENGIWGRWEEYAANGHGGNSLLKETIKKNGDYPSSFRYSVLQVLPKSTIISEVIRWEQRYKEKLGSRATGLNLN